MSAISPWLGMMRQSVDVAARTGETSRGKPTYGAATTYRARVVGKTTNLVDGNGRVIPYRHTAYLGTGDVIAPDSQVTLSTGFTGSTEAIAINPAIVDVKGPYPDERGRFVYSALFLQ